MGDRGARECCQDMSALDSILFEKQEFFLHPATLACIYVNAPYFWGWEEFVGGVTSFKKGLDSHLVGWGSAQFMFGRLGEVPQKREVTWVPNFGSLVIWVTKIAPFGGWGEGLGLSSENLDFSKLLTGGGASVLRASLGCWFKALATQQPPSSVHGNPSQVMVA